MDNIIDDIAIQVRRCETAAREFEENAATFRRIDDAVNEVGKSWSGSWLGYQSRVYFGEYDTPPVGHEFSIEWGFNSNWRAPEQVGWEERRFEDVVEEVLRRAGNPDLQALDRASTACETVTADARAEMLSTLDAVLAERSDKRLQEFRDELEKIPTRVSPESFAKSMKPRQTMSRDRTAMAQGFQPPPHLNVLARAQSLQSTGAAAEIIANLGGQVRSYLEKRMKMSGTSVAKKSGRVFIGHGRSSEWMKLALFLTQKLRLETDEFNREAVAGMTTMERLLQMLDESVFAFLVMTAEDEHADSTRHARENVIHEVGLFQGRLGPKRAIVLLEDDCAEFSNIIGLTQIRFPKGDVKARFEEVRGVLEREGLLPKG